MMAARLRHPHVITVLTVGRLAEPFDGSPTGAPYLVMDYLPRSLADRIADGQVLPESEVARIGADVARGLAYAHRQGIVHRDIKPENILFARDGRAVVTDFGIARALTGTPSGQSRQVLLGTPTFFSPEQARGLPLDGRSDLYALGITLYRTATGTPPFPSDDWYVVMRQHIEDMPLPPSSLRPELSPAFDAVIERALAKAPAARFETGDAMAEALDRLRGDAPSRSTTAGVPRAAVVGSAEPTPPMSQAAVSPLAPPPRAVVLAPSRSAQRVAPPRRGRRWLAAGLAAAATAIVGVRVLAVRGTPERVPGSAPPSTVHPNDVAPAASVPVTGPHGASAADSVRGGATAAAGAGGRPGVPVPGAPPSRSDSLGAPAASGGISRPTSTARKRPTTPDDPDLAAAARVPGAGPVGALTVTAPADADIFFNRQHVGHGEWRSGAIAPGRYTVRAVVPALPGCLSADTAAFVDVTPNVRRAVRLSPVACGSLILDITASSPAHYTLVPVHGGPAREGLLPLSEPLLLPDGVYRLTVEARACAVFNDDHVPVVAGQTRRENGKMLCQ